MESSLLTGKKIDIFTYVILSILIVATVFSVIFPFSEIFNHIPLAQNEGWNAYQIDRVINPALGPLYPDPENGLIFNNYPPLSFYLVGYFSKYVTHDVMVAGRIVSVTFQLLSCIVCSLCVRSLGAKPIGMILAFFIPFLYTVAYFGWWFATNDPQWVSIFFVLLSLLLAIDCLWNDRKSNYFIICLAAFLSVLAGTAKHNEISIPLVITIVLFFNNKKLFYTWCVSGILFSVMAFVYLKLMFGSDIISDVFFHPRVISTSLLFNTDFSIKHTLTLYIAAIPCLIGIKDKKLRQFLIIIFLVCFTLGVSQKVGDGVSENAHIDTVLALGIVIAMGASVFPQKWQGYRKPSMILLTILAITPPVIKSITHLPGSINDIRRIPEEQEKWNAVYSLLRSNSRPAACRMLSICYWAGEPYTVDMFNLGQYLQMNGNKKIFNDMVRNKEFGIIEYPFQVGDLYKREEGKLLPDFMKNYHLYKIIYIDDSFYRFDESMAFYAPNS
ncbi:hypothetical protein [Komagataeibacter sp. FXV3]|uniref:hypothetical protein n=1 Tax=Komagataeibacter sp. FXV3 TaxID=2608998 RepID=UPI00187B1C75|nr:hypothetical protein [Komagataeibacter sp. FXV3]MBE7729192.1 hypothetical protein [Komagataeibacter sp. FXV3]